MAVQEATLGGGCFWCLDAAFRQLEGVQRSVCGYAGGDVPSPTYERVCRGRTGHAEVVQVTFDPQVLPYEDLLEVFWSIHDPTTKDRQGADVGPQYRSIVLCHDEVQEGVARAKLREMQAHWDAPVVTGIVPLERFWPAEEHHQDYFARNPGQGYCRAVVAPKVAKFRKQWAHRLRA